MSNPIKVAIDLTPLRPGGENGGAKTLIITLLKLFRSTQNGEFQYLLIGEEWNREELLEFLSPNITFVLRSEAYDSLRPTQSDRAGRLKSKNLESLNFNRSSQFWKNLKHKTRLHLKIPIQLRISTLKNVIERTKKRLIRSNECLEKRPHLTSLSKHDNPIARPVWKSRSRLSNLYDVDLLFCPFSSPHLAEEGLPLVAIFYDLQHLDLPNFFSMEERSHRDRFLKNLVDKADRVICISDFSKHSFSNHFNAIESQLISIPICIHERLKTPSESFKAETLTDLKLQDNQYVFFPANFWPHKNHRMLLAAYSIYRHHYPATAVDLVFTGALEAPQRELREVATYLGCVSNVHFLGFLSEEEVSCVWQGCRGLVFPSLYEGFGIPVLEAMWFDKPVACSNLGSLPEVGGDAVIYFDPRQPEAIAKAIGQLAHDQELTTRLRQRARQHLRNFSQQSMAKQYLDVFREVVTANPRSVSTY
jgi:glycosyltransferase involved in cell wall biosynthesis